MKPTGRRPIDRPLERYIPEPNTGCHIWLGTINQFGDADFDRKRVHRLLWEAVHGPVPPGMELGTADHCRMRICINIDHRRLQPLGTSARRAASRRMCVRGHVLEKTAVLYRGRDGKLHRHCLACRLLGRERQRYHCKRGHEVNETNVVLVGKQRRCRTCHEARP